MSIESIKQKILALTQDHWDRQATAYLLSQLGLDLGPDRDELQHLTGKKILDFLREDMSGDLRIEAWPESPNIWGIFPAGAPLSDDLNYYFPQRKDTDTRIPRYLPSFWAAFAIPLKDGLRRYIDIKNDQIEFYDIPGDQSRPSDTLEIDRSHIPPLEAPERAGKILEEIKSWTAKNQLNRHDFTIAASRLKTTYRSREPLSILHYMIDVLDEQELRKISLPLDTIAKLLRRIPRR